MKRPERTEREAAALRANLLKRKDQARRRAAADDAATKTVEIEDAESQTDQGDKQPPCALKQ
jgi:hypothetical protein